MSAQALIYPSFSINNSWDRNFAAINNHLNFKLFLNDFFGNNSALVSAPSTQTPYTPL